jgi:branched-chain amino acid transport system substrate-binding protein
MRQTHKNILAILTIITISCLLSMHALADDTTGVTKDAIKIGIMGPFTGNASSYSKAEMGLMAFYKQINDQGGINGRKIEIIQEDTGCSEAKGIAAAKKLIYQNEVFMLHGNSCSGAALAMKPTIQEAGLPWIIAHAVNDKLSTPVVKNIFHGVPTSLSSGYSMSEFAMSKPGTTKIAIVAHSNEWAKGYRDPAVDLLKKDYNVEPILDLTMERSSTDATPQVLKIKKSGAQFVLAILYEAETAIFLRDAHKFGLNIPVMGGYGTDLENTLKRVGDINICKNYFVLHTFIDTIEGPLMTKWRDLVKKYYPEIPATAFTYISIGSGVAVAKALKATGANLTRERFIAELNKIRDLNTECLAGRITWTPTDHVGVKKNAVAGFVDGKPTIFKSWDKKL